MTDPNIDKLTPPPELVQQIRTDALHRSDGQLDYELRMIHAAYRAGADTELEACCEWANATGWEGAGDSLRATRRPPAIPEPIPVSERLPEAGDCDEQGRCWLLSNVVAEWRLLSAANPGVQQLKHCFSHWLPAHALPLPKEVG